MRLPFMGKASSIPRKVGGFSRKRPRSHERGDDHEAPSGRKHEGDFANVAGQDRASYAPAPHADGAAALALGAPAFIRKANAQSKFDWKRFAGQKIDVVLAKSPRADIYQRYEKEFTELTGIEVSSEQIPEQQQRQKVMIEFTSGSPSFDVVNLALHVQKRIAAKGKVDGGSALLSRRRRDHHARLRFRRFRQGRPRLCDAERRPARYDPDLRRLLDDLLQQGALRAEGHRIPEIARRA